MLVLSVGGEVGYGEHVGEAMATRASDLQSVAIAGAGHWIAEQAPEDLLAALTSFLDPYRTGSTVQAPAAAAAIG